MPRAGGPPGDEQAPANRGAEPVAVSQSTREAALRSRFAQADWLAAEIAQLRAEWRLDRHPFMQRWMGGELTAVDLQLFAAEHHHAVIALEEVGRRAAALSDGLLAEQLAAYAEAQAESVELSCQFAVATGWGRSAWYFAQDPLAPTEACAGTWVGATDTLAEHLVTIHAVESGLAELAPRQLEALVEHHGLDMGSARYFVCLAERGAGNGALAEAALTGLLPLDSPGILVHQAEMAYRCYAGLLDGVQMLSQRSV
jgi:pyrroloquinoline quinone (PQQ) biosynthesis protein C